MATRNDIAVDYNVSPRIITVAAPSIELLMQDLVDTLRVIEARLDRGISELSLLDAFGKQPLFSGVSVGITVTLQNAQVEFEARTTPAMTGTHTGGSGSQFQLVDSGADFVAAGVARGSLVVNFTDLSVGTVLLVVSPTTLEVSSLGGGTDDDFDTGDVYKIWNVAQVEALGGNLTAVDELGDPIDPMLSTFATQVLRALSSSATLVDQERVKELHQIHGLDSANPLTITDTSRSAGAIAQTIDDVGGTTTVART